jgi:REP element-mobilizing transposase RayT
MAGNVLGEICTSEDVVMVKGNVSKGPGHLLLSLPPQVSPSRIMQAVKVKSSHHP